MLAAGSPAKPQVRDDRARERAFWEGERAFCAGRGVPQTQPGTALPRRAGARAPAEPSPPPGSGVGPGSGRGGHVRWIRFHRPIQ